MKLTDDQLRYLLRLDEAAKASENAILHLGEPPKWTLEREATKAIRPLVEELLAFRGAAAVASGPLKLELALNLSALFVALDALEAAYVDGSLEERVTAAVHVLRRFRSVSPKACPPIHSPALRPL